MTTIMDGKALSEKIYQTLEKEVDTMIRKPCLSVIITDDNEAGKVYVRNKQRACEKVGVISNTILLSATISENDLLNQIDKLNNDDNIDAILVQLPLPKHIDSEKILNKISPDKVADGFHYANAGKLFTGQMPKTIACTPKGIINILDEYNIQIQGKLAVVIGRSNIVGKPIAQLLLQRNATVIMAHSKTENLQELTKQADILVVAVGKPKFLKADMIKDNAVVIDVGISKIDGKLSGDVDFENVSQKCSFITPVPGGVGPMTVAMLMQNTINLGK